MIQFIRFNNNIGILKKGSEDVTIIGADGNLAAWPLCQEKKTYRFCAETERNYVVYNKDTDQLQIKPIQYKFAVKFN